MANTTIIEELRLAARGVAGLIIGDRKAADYFDFSQRGLVGSFIVLLVLILVDAGLPYLMGVELPPGYAIRTVTWLLVPLGLQIGAAAIALSMMGRLDGLGPYLVTTNWSAFLIVVVANLVSLSGIPPVVIAFALLGLGLVITINICRIVVTLSALQIAAFLIALIVGGSIGLIMVGMMFPPSSEELAAMDALRAASSPPA